MRIQVASTLEISQIYKSLQIPHTHLIRLHDRLAIEQVPTLLRLSIYILSKGFGNDTQVVDLECTEGLSREAEP